MQPAGHLLVECLKQQGVERVFCVPGESYLAVLDGLYDSGIETIVARHEGGASIMAEADGKMTGRPGICFVTRGPGCNQCFFWGTYCGSRFDTDDLVHRSNWAADAWTRSFSGNGLPRLFWFSSQVGRGNR